MGEMLVPTWLAAHKGQMPAHLWEKRQREWTPAVSARGWRETLEEMAVEGENGRSCIYLACTEANKLVGFAAAFGSENKADLVALYVKQAWQGQGIGRALLQTTANHLHTLGIAVLQIGVLAANQPPRRFYERMGGKLVGERSLDEEGIPLPEAVYELATGA
jgi:GNAT superfamily N-acetyltransferase